MHGNIIDTYEVQGESVEYLWRSENGGPAGWPRNGIYKIYVSYAFGIAGMTNTIMRRNTGL